MIRAAAFAALPQRAMFDIRGSSSCLAAAGLASPAEFNTVRAFGAREVCWVGPRRWLVVGPLDDEAALAAALGGAAEAATLVADVTDMYAAFRIEGAGAADLLAQGTPLDLHPRVFVADGATFTELFATTALVRRRGEGFEIAVERSYAAHIESWLRAAVGPRA